MTFRVKVMHFYVNSEAEVLQNDQIILGRRTYFAARDANWIFLFIYLFIFAEPAGSYM